MATKRKLNLKSIEDKYNALCAVEKGVKSKSVIAKEYGVPSNTLSTWLKNAEKIKKAYESECFGASRKKMRLAKHEDVEKALYQWLLAARSDNIPISGEILKEKAEQLAVKLGETDWLCRFKERHSVVYKSVQGESKDVNQDDVKEWHSSVLPRILKEYQPKDIFNADETGFFYKLLPNKTYTYKGDQCSGGKKSKERLTVMVCANMDGSEKSKLLVIGKSLKPRCFKNVNTLPTEYTANKKAWMTSEVFTEWLHKMDKKFHTQKRNVAMIVDNCPAHPHVKNLKAIKLYFLPPNTTSVTQPMDQGVIQNLKVHYRKFVVASHLKAIDEKKDVQLTILGALHYIKQAWDAVKPETVSNCFFHVIYNEKLHEITENSAQIDTGISAEEFQDYVAVDSVLRTAEQVTDDTIIDSIKDTDAEENDSDHEDDQPEVKIPSFSRGLSICDELRLLIQSRKNSFEEYEKLADIEKFLRTEMHISKSQSKIDKFFMPSSD